MSARNSSSAAANHPSRRGTIANAPGRKIGSRRTTITLSPESQQIVEHFKSATGTSTSAAIDRIIQQSDPKPSRLKVSELGLLVLDLPEDQETVHFTIGDLKQAEDDMDRAYVERLMQRPRTPASNRSRTGRRK
jgi:hypothetical protein